MHLVAFGFATTGSSNSSMRDTLPEQLRNLAWLLPWEPTNADLAAELSREVGSAHVLAGRPAVAVARRVDQDDVLFWLPEGPAMLATVHLTYAGRERSANWPSAQLYSSADEWIEFRMRVDHAEYFGTPRAEDA